MTGGPKERIQESEREREREARERENKRSGEGGQKKKGTHIKRGQVAAWREKALEDS